VLAFLPGEIAGTNVRVEPRPGTNVPCPLRLGKGGHLYRVEVPPGTNEGFIGFLCFFSLTYLLNVLILILICYNIKLCGI
jgi:hypothetical protein